MLVLKHISSHLTSPGPFIFQALAGLELNPLPGFADQQHYLWLGLQAQTCKPPASFQQRWAPSAVWKAPSFLPKFQVYIYRFEQKFSLYSSCKPISSQYSPLSQGQCNGRLWDALQRANPSRLPPSRADCPRCAREAEQKGLASLRHPGHHWELGFSSVLCRADVHWRPLTIRPRDNNIFSWSHEFSLLGIQGSQTHCGFMRSLNMPV